LELPDFVHGKSLVPQIKNPNVEGHTAYAYTNRAKTIRNASHRLTLHNDGYVELYDHTTPEKETKNVAQQNPAVVKALAALINQKGPED